jgi:putative ABC transport system permease protein
MLRDIKKHKVQFISIFLMAFLGVFIFTGVSEESFGLEDNSNQFYEDTNLADGWIYSPYLNDMFLEQVYLLGATTQMERQAVVESEADFEDRPDITLHFVENNTVSKFYLIDGQPLDINDSNGVWLDKSFADAKGLKVGDNITFNFEGHEINKQIRGLGYSPEYVYHASKTSVLPNFNKSGFAYLSYMAFPDGNVSYNVLNVKFDGEPDTYNKLLDYRLEGYYVSFLERSEHSSVSHFAEQISLHKMMADIFPIVFIAVSMLILLTTMKRIIAKQRTQIGILKACGFKNRSLIWHYLSYGFWMVLAGSLLGLILGPMVLPKLIYSVMNHIFILPSWETSFSWNFVSVEVFIVLIALVVSFYSADSILDESPSESIKPKASKYFKTSFIERLGFWRKLSFNTRWNYRDVKRNKFRALMTIIGVIGCTALLVCAFGLHDSVEDLTEWEFYQISHYDTDLYIDHEASQNEIDEVADKVNGDEIMDSSIEIESPTAKKSGLLLVLGKTDLITPTDNNRNEIKINDDDISISQKMADLLGVTIGDTVKWHSMDSNKWVETKITKIHADSNSQGLIITKQKLQELGLNYTPTRIVTNNHIDNNNYSAIKSFSSKETRIQNWNDLMMAAGLLIFVLIIAAASLSVIVIYNLGLLSFIEIQREIATMKVLGFKTSALRKLLLTQNLWFTSIGFILGVPLGYFILKTMWESAGDSFYVVPTVSPTNILLTAIITFSLSILVNLMFSNKIRRVDMVETFKNMD